MKREALAAGLVGAGVIGLCAIRLIGQQPMPPAAPPASAPAAARTFVGNDVCITCHADIGKNLLHTQHGKAGFAARSTLGCETCHGPGSAHIEDPTNHANIRRPDRLRPAESSALCLSCHQDARRADWHGGTHEARGLSCTTCHSVHDFKSEKAQLKAASVMDVCFNCHKDVRADMWKTSHHPIREGKLSCGDCHNPHGTTTKGMIVAASVNEQCYTCHQEKRGPFLWEHPPVRESCLSCHVPHGSSHVKLTKNAVPFLCQQCHSNTRHPGTMYDALSEANGAHAANRLFARGCENCHGAIHGSNNPSSPYLGQ